MVRQKLLIIYLPYSVFYTGTGLFSLLFLSYFMERAQHSPALTQVLACLAFKQNTTTANIHLHSTSQSPERQFKDK